MEQLTRGVSFKEITGSPELDEEVPEQFDEEAPE